MAAVKNVLFVVMFVLMFAHMCVYVSVCVANNYVYKNSLYKYKHQIHQCFLYFLYTKMVRGF